jgi:sortase A
MKNRKSTIVLLLVFLIGLSLLLYPTISNYWNTIHQSRAISRYAEAVANLDDTAYSRYWAEAESYNMALLNNPHRYSPSKEDNALYERLLNISDSGIMGYIEIPSIGISLPIYHGVKDTVLQIAIGHIEGTSLPVGGPSTHCVLSGHRGLPSAKLFTDLDKLAPGDLFLIRVLDDILTYEVDAIHIVEPDDLSFLEIEEGRDLCTLVTCTPYSINSHRMLVRGHRVENQQGVPSNRIIADAMQIDPILVAPAVAAPMLLVLLIALLIRTSDRGRKNTRKK